MPCGHHIPRYKTKKAAKRHGAIQYGKGDFTVRKVKGGYKAYEK